MQDIRLSSSGSFEISTDLSSDTLLNPSPSISAKSMLQESKSKLPSFYSSADFLAVAHFPGIRLTHPVEYFLLKPPFHIQDKIYPAHSSWHRIFCNTFSFSPCSFFLLIAQKNSHNSHHGSFLTVQSILVFTNVSYPA